MISQLFLPWLSARQQDWLTPLKQSREGGAKSWFHSNRVSLRQAESECRAYLPLYLPRQVFGQFLQDFLHDTISDAEGKNLANVRSMNGQVVSISKELSGVFRVAFADGVQLLSRRIVLGIGSPPSAAYPELQHAPNYISGSDQWAGSSALEKSLAEQLSPGASCRTIVMLGSSAAAMESLYLLWNLTGACNAIERVVVVSSSGLLPDHHSARTCSVTTRVKHSSSEGSPKAEKLLLAVAGDLAESRAAAGPRSYDAGTFSEAFDRAFAALPLFEKRRFVNEFGADFCRLNRHAPPEYVGAVRAIQNTGKLHVMKGYVEEIKTDCKERGEFDVRVAVENGGRLSLPGAILVDCRGPAALSAQPTRLLSSLIHPRTGVVRVNESGRGIQVNENLEANSNLYVIGPLLAGHSSNKDWLWNLESAPRIYSLANRLAETLASRLSDGTDDRNHSD